MLFKKIYHFGDKLEDKVRGKLSHYPIIYAFFGGAGVIIFWRGIWRVGDFFSEYFHTKSFTAGPNLVPWWDGPICIVLGITILLLVGLFVSSFIGNEIIISGMRGEKKLDEKTEDEIRADLIADLKMKTEIKKISEKIEVLEKELEEELKKILKKLKPV